VLNREGQFEWRMITCPIPAPDWHHWGVVIVRVVARPGARTHDDDTPTTRLRLYTYTTRRYAVHAAAGVTLNAGHVSELGRGVGVGCIQPTTLDKLVPDPFLV